MTKLIEFHGPYHFVKTKYGEPTNPFTRKENAENCFGSEYIVWPYWIPRCYRNVRAIFEENTFGIGAIWSANIHFGEFFFTNSAEIIHKISFRFKTYRNNGYGYFYETGIEGIVKPEHPILAEIQNGYRTKDILLPKGYGDKSVWLPEKIKNA